MKYVDGFVIAIPKRNTKTYAKMAKWGRKIWMKHGALEYFECVGDDLDPDMQGMAYTSFPKLTRMKKNETVWFSFIVFRSKAHRDRVNAKVMKEMNAFMEKHKDMKMPFEMKKFSYGGFKAVVEG